MCAGMQHAQTAGLTQGAAVVSGAGALLSADNSDKSTKGRTLKLYTHCIVLLAHLTIQYKEFVHVNR